MAVELYAFREGNRLQRVQPLIRLGAGPFVGMWRWRISAAMFPAAVVAAAGVMALPVAARELRARWSVPLTAFVASGFALALAASDGWQAVIAPVIHPTEYWAGTREALPAGEYLRTYLDRQATYSVHVRGHPPGFSLILIAMRAAGLASPWAAAALSFGGITVAVMAVAFVVHRLAGPDAMRRCLPFLALAPYAVWQGTSADAFFLGVTAAGIALVVVAATTLHFRREVAAGIGAGVVLTGACFLSFGTPTLFPLVAGLTWKARRARWLVPAAAGGALVVALFAAGGYWWKDGLDNTRHFYAIGTAKLRPAFYFFFANLAVLAIALGPAALAGLTRVRAARDTRVIVAGALASVLLADLSGYSKAETERIWLIFMPWIAVAAGSLVVRRSERGLWRTRAWLAAQATSAIVVQAALVSKW